MMALHLALLLLFVARPAVADPGAMVGAPEAPPPTRSVDPDGVGVEPHPGSVIPGDIVLRSEDGRPVTTGQLFAARPALLSLVYYRCPNLCTVTLSTLVERLKPLGSRFGRDADLVVVSIDPDETPALGAAKAKAYLDKYGDPVAPGGWRFLTADEASVRRLAQAVGIRYTHDAKTGQYFHPAAVLSVAPGGTIKRYLLGLGFTSKDLRLALAEARGQYVGGSPVEGLLLLCFHFDAATGHYTLAVMRALRIAGVGFLSALLWLIVRLARGGRREVTS